MTAIQVAEIDRPIPELVYDGTEGYVVEVDGEWVASAATYAQAAGAARRLAAGGRTWRDEGCDYWGRQTWTACRG